METYDPLTDPEPTVWQAMDEDERLSLIEEFHKQARIRMPNRRLHATLHTVVENQVAMGDETPVKAALARLMTEGLDRHDAIHAIGCVLAEHLHGMMTSARPDDPNAEYFKRVRELTADEWRDIGRTP
ncbi:MAG: DUF1841 family protein [Verrucomicrobia bacterium]|nr:DUF1841 family protein [Verrucomicrobiota bacterium]